MDPGRILEDLWDYLLEVGWRMFFWGTLVVVGTVSAFGALLAGNYRDFLWSAGITVGLPLMWSIVFYFGFPGRKKSDDERST
jgi:hypothetical protein